MSIKIISTIINYIINNYSWLMPILLIFTFISEMYKSFLFIRRIKNYVKLVKKFNKYKVKLKKYNFKNIKFNLQKIKKFLNYKTFIPIILTIISYESICFTESIVIDDYKLEEKIFYVVDKKGKLIQVYSEEDKLKIENEKLEYEKEQINALKNIITVLFITLCIFFFLYSNFDEGSNGGNSNNGGKSSFSFIFKFNSADTNTDTNIPNSFVIHNNEARNAAYNNKNVNPYKVNFIGKELILRARVRKYMKAQRDLLPKSFIESLIKKPSSNFGDDFNIMDLCKKPYSSFDFKPINKTHFDSDFIDSLKTLDVKDEDSRDITEL